jgi:hypothetical protein
MINNVNNGKLCRISGWSVMFLLNYDKQYK